MAQPVQREADAMINNVLREIADGCAKDGERVPEGLPVLVLRVTTIDPDHEFANKTLSRREAKDLVNVCVSKILDKTSISMSTMKMQALFDNKYKTRQQLQVKQKELFEYKLQPLIREITDMRAHDKEEFEDLYRMICSCILVRSGLGSPTDLNVVREVSAALHSVFPPSELGTFCALRLTDKERHLQDFTKIVMGIRLFNRVNGKGGFGIEELPDTVEQEAALTQATISEELKVCAERICLYTNVMEIFDSHGGNLNRNKVRSALYNVRQFETYLVILQADISETENQITTVVKRYKSNMELLQNTVQGRTTIPTEQVYPLFIELGEGWIGLQTEEIIVGKYNSILAVLKGQTQNLSSVHEQVLEYMRRAPSITELEKRTQPSEERINPHDYPDIKFLLPEYIKDFDKFPTEYNGFCGWTFVNRDGLLLPGVAGIGVLEYKKAIYKFTSVQAAIEFGSAPQDHIDRIGELVRKNPELILLLKLYDQFETMFPTIKEEDKLLREMVTMTDNDTQTDVHILESNIDRDYQWNEWELRRKALMLTNLRGKETHSAQTSLSHLRRENCSQVYLPKTSETQTKEDSVSTVPKPEIFITGLRGKGTGTKTAATKVDLTVQVTEKFV